MTKYIKTGATEFEQFDGSDEMCEKYGIRLKDVEKLVSLAESLIPKVTAYERSVGMNVTDKFTTIPTDNEVLQISDSVYGIFRKKHPDYEVKCWNRSFWDNLKRQYYKCVWLTVRKAEVEE